MKKAVSLMDLQNLITFNSMTEKLAFAIAFVPVFTGILIMRLTYNARYLTVFAYLSGLSAILILVLTRGYVALSLPFFGLMLFVLFIKWRWYRNK